MSTTANWSEVKVEARTVDPDWNHPDRINRRARMREEMLASVSGAQLDLRKQIGLTQAQLARATGLTQARISQIEKGGATSLDTMRAYITGLGGHVDIVARIGNIQLSIA